MINQESLKSQIIKALWELIIEGHIKPNEPLRETNLASLLNISRTPLREALQQLEWENIVVSEPRKGFRLAPLSEEDILEIYPLRAKLESFALELSGVPTKHIINELFQINSRILKAKSSKEIVELDEQWHLLLISNCQNKRLLKMVKTLHRQSQRYEYAYLAMNKTVEKSVIQHEKIIKYLQKNQLQKATEIFAKNNLVGVDSLINWLKQQENEH
ncbi:GntR family transcriptional regulator [Tenacibaculum gallaicum]|uniref:GntR family transcriptional regulator n=1 Tax=Tenacibaculum gallaicum TaxID=561505 RepID=A0A3E0HQQ6_9FLAO|nr:GntR family transcriptional regulator [Tenacibaculum gallaicum]REH48893.1 GntR family transcriptional regulator [Tenacibaculum gallaicum]